MKRRSCLNCRERQAAKTMIPLGLGPGGSLLVGYRSTGRTGWICPPCVPAVTIQRGPLGRCFRTKPPDTSSLVSDAKEFLESSWWKDLQLAHQQGLVVSGAAKVREIDPQALIVILLSADAGASTKSAFVYGNTGLETYIISNLSERFSVQFNCGPRSVIGLKSGRSTQSLLNTLRKGVSLG